MISGFTRAIGGSSSSPVRTTARRRSDPTWGAASPTPRASCMIATIRATSSRRASSNSVTVEGRRAQDGVAELADLLERGESPALQDGVVEGA